MSAIEVEKIILSNGLPILAIPTKQAPVVALQAWIRFGAADETDEIAGLAHLFEHLLFKGTNRRAVGQIAKEIESLGGDVNAYTSYDQTVMHLTVGSSHLRQGLDILSDAILDSVVDGHELEKEKKVILEEIARRNDMPGAVASDLLHTTLFAGHPYARPVIGYADVVANMPRERIVELYKKNYNAHNMFLVVSGDFDPQNLSHIAEELFGPLPKGQRSTERPHLKPLLPQTSEFVQNPYPHPIAHLTWRGPSLRDPSVPSLDAFSLVVGNGESSRLHKKLVLEKKWLQSIGTGVWSPKDQGCFDLGIRGHADFDKRFDDSLKLIRDELMRPITERELEVAKNNLISENVYAKETVDGMAQKFGYFEVIAGDYREDAQYTERVRELTTKDLEVARDQWLTGDWVVTGIRPEKMKAPKAKKTFWNEKPESTTASANKSSKLSLNTEHNVESFNFGNLKVVVRNLKHLPIFSLRLVGLGGARIEPPSKSGIGRMWEHAVLAGHRGHDEKLWNRTRINEFIDASTSSLGSFHGRNSQGFNIDGLSKDFESLFELILGMRANPIFSEEDLKIERSQHLSEIKSSASSPTSVLNHMFREAMYGAKHPYGKSALGDADFVKRINTKDLKTYHQSLVKTPTVLSVVGDVCAERVYRFLNEHLNSKSFVPHTKEKFKPIIPKHPKKEMSLRKTLDKEQSHLLRGYPTCNFRSQDRWGLLALSAILSGQGGRLFLELRDKLSLCYSVSPTHMEAIDGGHFGVYIGTTPEKVQTSIEAIDRELEKIAEHGVTNDEWNLAKTYYSGNHIIDQQRLSSQCMSMALEELYGFGWKSYFEFDEHLKAIKTSDIKAVAKKYLIKSDQRVTALVEPKKAR
jgi:zinc protease